MENFERFVEDSIIYQEYEYGVMVVGIDEETWKESETLRFPNRVKDGRTVDAMAADINFPESVGLIILPDFMTDIHPHSLRFSEIEEVVLGNEVQDLHFIYNSESVYKVGVSTSSNHYVEYEGNLYTQDLIGLMWASNGNIASGVEYISKMAFKNLVLKKVVLPPTLIKIDSKAFIGCKISCLEIPGSTGFMYSQSIHKCSIQELVIKDGTKPLMLAERGISESKIEKLEVLGNMLFREGDFYLTEIKKLHIHKCVFEEDSILINELGIEEIYLNKKNIIPIEERYPVTPNQLFGNGFDAEIKKYPDIVYIHKYKNSWVEKPYW